MLEVIKKYAVVVVVLVIACAGAIPAHAVTLTFEDLKSICNTTPFEYGYYNTVIQNGYGGLNWSNFMAIDAPQAYPVSGYTNGRVSGDIVIYNGWADPASVLQTTAPIVLHSAYLTGAWDDGLRVKADGYLGGVLKYTKTVTLSYYQPTFVNYGFNNVDRIEWSSLGGTHFAMDNLSYDIAPVPEPSSILTLLCGIGTLGGLVLRRRSA